MPSRPALAQELHDGLDRGELFLLYQPQVDMAGGRVPGAEALCRWRHPVRGLLLPMDFVHEIAADPVADRLADWVIGEAVDRLAAWTADGPPLLLSVNVGTRQMARPGLAARLAHHLSRLPSGRGATLGLEALESHAVDDLTPVAEFITVCRGMGVRVVLDDFGTGSASMAWLRQLPVTGLKLDQRFVRGMLDHAADAAIVRHVLALARDLQLEVVAEGVESRAHGEALMALGCRFGQGFGIARPLPADRFAAWRTAYEQAPPCWGAGSGA